MDPPSKPPSTTLFEVYLRLRPPPSSLIQITPQSLYPLLTPPERYLTVEEPARTQNNDHGTPTHITLNPPSDSRKRAVEKFAFTKVFEEDASQSDLFGGAGVVPLIEGVLGEGRDGLLATLGVTGSGKVGSREAWRVGGVREMDVLMVTAESYHTGVEIAARAYADGARCPFAIAWFENAASVLESDARLNAGRNRCVRGSDTFRVEFPGRDVWRWACGTSKLESTNTHDGRHSLDFWSHKPYNPHIPWSAWSMVNTKSGWRYFSPRRGAAQHQTSQPIIWP